MILRAGEIIFVLFILGFLFLIVAPPLVALLLRWLDYWLGFWSRKK